MILIVLAFIFTCSEDGLYLLCIWNICVRMNMLVDYKMLCVTEPRWDWWLWRILLPKVVIWVGFWWMGCCDAGDFWWCSQGGATATNLFFIILLCKAWYSIAHEGGFFVEARSCWYKSSYMAQSSPSSAIDCTSAMYVSMSVASPSLPVFCMYTEIRMLNTLDQSDMVCIFLFVVWVVVHLPPAHCSNPIP